jgi:LacI family transcriptional regulator
MSITIIDIAKRLGLSDSTVSRVLNSRRSHLISEKTREKVLAAAEDMGYRPNKMASALVTGRSHTIAFWVSPERTGYYTQIMYHFQDQLKSQGYDLVMDEIPLSRWPFDGIIACDASPALLDTLEQQPQFRVPVVSVGAYYWKNMDFVGIDLYAGATEAMKHLLSSGRRRIAFVTFNTSPSEARFAAYTALMKEAGREPEIIQLPNSQRAPARQAIREYVQSKGCPEGIFCCNDNLAIGTHRGLRDAGIRMPEDTALVGCDGIEDTEYHDPPISTIDMGLGEMCRRGCEFLLRRIHEPASELQQAILKPTLVIRESSKIQKEPPISIGG